MKTNWIRKALSVVLAGAMVVCLMAAASVPTTAYAAEEDDAGKESFFDNNKVQDQNVAAAMGIRRTDDENNAITDMAVMNMTGGYSIPDYETLLNEKKGQIKEFINNFMVVIEEFRTNYNGEGSSAGQLALAGLGGLVLGILGGTVAINGRRKKKQPAAQTTEN